MINGLLSNHLKENVDDLHAVKAFKKVVRDQIEERFDFKSSVIADRIPVLAAALDPHYHHMKFLSTSQRTMTVEKKQDKDKGPSRLSNRYYTSTSN